MTEPARECGMRPIHPGEILRDELAELGISARAFARAQGNTTNMVTHILNEQRGISADTPHPHARNIGSFSRAWAKAGTMADTCFSGMNRPAYTMSGSAGAGFSSALEHPSSPCVRRASFSF